MRLRFLSLRRGLLHEKKWHAIVQAAADGATPPGSLDIDSPKIAKLRRRTDKCVSGWQEPRGKHGLPQVEMDAHLSRLIGVYDASSEHAAVAFLGCLDVLSAAEATRHLESLSKFAPPLMYFQCVVAAYRCRPDVDSSVGMRDAELLIQLLEARCPNFDAFRSIAQAASRLYASPSAKAVLFRALGVSDFKTRARHDMLPLRQQRHYASLSDLTLWRLHAACEHTRDLVSIHFPDWRLYAPWRPDIARISRWQSAELTERQRLALRHIFDLEGPSAFGQYGTLKQCESECYQHVSLATKDQANLTRLLNLTDAAVQAGTQAVDILIYFCVYRTPDDVWFSVVEDGIAGDAALRSALLSLHHGLAATGGTMARCMSLETCLLGLETPRIQRLLRGEISEVLPDILRDAQRRFCDSLRASETDEACGMELFRIGMAIRASTWLHPALSSAVTAFVFDLPSPEQVETALAAIEALKDPQSGWFHSNSLLKDFLLVYVGGAVVADDLDPLVGSELAFWAAQPLPLAVRFARAIDRTHGLSYRLYCACLHQSQVEDVQITESIVSALGMGGTGGCRVLARTLARQRELDEPVSEHWISLLVCLIKEEGLAFVEGLRSIPHQQLQEFMSDIPTLVNDDHPELVGSGLGRAFEWWGTLDSRYKAAVSFIASTLDYASLMWLYRLPTTHVVVILEECRKPSAVDALSRYAIARLDVNGENAPRVAEFISRIKAASDIGRAVIERLIVSIQSVADWESLETIANALLQSSELPKADISVLQSLCALSGLLVSKKPQSSMLASASLTLGAKYDAIRRSGTALGRLQAQLRRAGPARLARILRVLDAEAPTPEHPGVAIPEALVDSVFLAGDDDYELAFALTALSDLQKKARGIPEGRCLLVRLQLRRATFCIHVPDALDSSLCDGACATTPSPFTTILETELTLLLAVGSTLQTIHERVLELISDAPSACITCREPLGLKLWMYAGCSQQCSRQLGTPLEARLHGIVFDPSVLDLLLTCVYAAAGDNISMGALPPCPVPREHIVRVIDSFPSPDRLSSSADLRDTLRVPEDGLADARENLLSWLALTFRGFITSAPDSLRIPSMGKTIQLAMLSSPRERESAFRAASGGVPGRPVFHGTTASRLLPILANGLVMMSGTAGQTNGASYGPGVYCGENPQVSLPFSCGIGSLWRGSSLQNRRVMLGCELTGQYRLFKDNIVLVSPAERLLVRYIFLLPPDFQPPPRRHVEPAMSSAFSTMGAGM